MASIFDDFSALHNLKQQHGLSRSSIRRIQPYVEECEFRQKLRDELGQTTIREASKACGLSTFRIRELIEDRVLDLGKRGLSEAVEILESEGLTECLKYLHEA